MKKIIALVLTLAMMMTLFVSISVSAEIVETPLFTQDFESTTSDNGPGGSALYPERHWKSGGADGSGALVTGVSYGSGNQSTSYFGNKVKENNQVRATVGIDSAKFEEGKKYKIVAMVKLNRASTKKDAELSLTVSALNAYGTTSYNASGNTTIKKNSIKDTGDNWVRVETAEFSYFKANFKDAPYLGIEFLATKVSDSDRDILYVDNVQLMNVTEEFTQDPIFTRANGTFNFESIPSDYTLTRNLDYASNKTAISFANDIGGETGRCLKLGYDGGYDRYVLLGFFNEKDLGKKFNISLRVYPEGPKNLSNKGIRIGVKGDPDGNGSNSNLGTWIRKTVGEEGSGKDLTLNKWNTVSFAAEIKTVTGYPTTKLFIDQRESHTVSNVYIDDITITESSTPPVVEEPYFKNLAGKTLNFEDAKTLTKDVDWSAGGGYGGAVSISNDTANTGSYSLKIAGRNSKGCWNYYRAKFLNVFADAKVGDAYKVTAYFKGAGANSDDTSIGFGAISNKSTEDIVAVKVNINNQTWTKGEFTYIVQNNSKGNFEDALFVDQGTFENVQNQNCDIIYVDDLTVEKLTPAAGAPVFAYYDGRPSADLLNTAFVVDAAKFAGAAKPFVVVAAYDANDNLINARTVVYEEGTTNYKTGSMLVGRDNVSKVKIFTFDQNGALISAIAGAESHGFSK